jgi:Sec-independent protein translocase protein TatA
MGLGPLEILLIGSLFLLLFGPGRLLEIAHGLSAALASQDLRRPQPRTKLSSTWAR